MDPESDLPVLEEDIKDEAQDDDELLKQLAGMVMKKADPRSHNKPQSRWELKPIEENASKEEIIAQIQKLQPIADKLEFGPSEARDITKQIKYADVHILFTWVVHCELRSSSSFTDY